MNPASAIAALIASGMTEVQIGDAVGTRQSSINRIRHNKQKATYDIGVALVRLAEEKAKETAEAAANDPAADAGIPEAA